MRVPVMAVGAVVVGLALGALAPEARAVPALYSTTLSGNTTSAADSTYTGAPDDTYWGLGGQVVTYDFGSGASVTDGPGQDFNVYEVDSGSVELGAMDVLVSADGVSFFSVWSSWAAAVDLDGDEAHGSASFRRSHDLGPSGLGSVRWIRVDGGGTGPSGAMTGFDLDAIGAANFSLAPPPPSGIPAPASLVLLGAGLASLWLAGLGRALFLAPATFAGDPEAVPLARRATPRAPGPPARTSCPCRGTSSGRPGRTPRLPVACRRRLAPQPP